MRGLPPAPRPRPRGAATSTKPDPDAGRTRNERRGTRSPRPSSIREIYSEKTLDAHRPPRRGSVPDGRALSVLREKRFPCQEGEPLEARFGHEKNICSHRSRSVGRVPRRMRGRNRVHRSQRLRAPHEDGHHGRRCRRRFGSRRERTGLRRHREQQLGIVHGRRLEQRKLVGRERHGFEQLELQRRRRWTQQLEFQQFERRRAWQLGRRFWVELEQQLRRLVELGRPPNRVELERRRYDRVEQQQLRRHGRRRGNDDATAGSGRRQGRRHGCSRRGNRDGHGDGRRHDGRRRAAGGRPAAGSGRGRRWRCGRSGARWSGASA